MKPRLPIIAALLLSVGMAGAGIAAAATAPASATVAADSGVASAAGDAGAASAAAAGDASSAAAPGGGKSHHHHRIVVESDADDADHARVSIMSNQSLPAGEHADSVVTVMGNAVIAGDVAQDVVSVMGNSRVTGPVDGDVVSVMGNTYVNNTVGGDVVAVMGNIELGPEARVDGQVKAIAGTIVNGGSGAVSDDFDVVTTGMQGIDFSWLQNWFTNCLAKGRLLAFAPGLGWAWTVALISLAFYVLSAALLRRSVQRYVTVLDEHPGESLIAAFITLLGTPVLLVLLCITVIGILAIPFLGIALLIAASFGRIVMLAWLGHRLLRPAGNEAWLHPAATVLVGGLVVTVLYAVPVVGMITFQLIGFIGMGVVAYGLLLALRERRQENDAPPPAMPGSGAGVAAAGVAAAGVAAAAVSPAPGVAPAIDAGPAAPGIVMPAAISAAAYPRAGFWIRMLALFIDVLVVSVVMHFVLDSGKLHLLLLAAYGAVMWKLKGATLGGMIFHLHVVRLDGRPIDWGTAIVRALGCFLSLIVAFLGFIWIAVDSERQAWHDKIAGTVVVRLPKGVPLV